MSMEVNEEIKKIICQLISTPGITIEDIAKKVNLDYDTVREILSDEYFRHNLDHGRRLCCRF
ncbi:MAG: winged helix-turn-helix transcriptional regulator [Promethearchaeota archaeon]